MAFNAKHREDLLALQRSDPDFYDYLNQTDQSLLSFGVEQEQGAFKDEDDDTADGEHGEDDKALPPVKAKPHSSVLVEVTSEMVRGWEKRLMSSEHTASLKELVAAFRAAVSFGDSETSEDEVFTFSSARVFNELMNLCLQSMDDMLKRHVAGGGKCGRRVMADQGWRRAPRSVGALAAPSALCQIFLIPIDTVHWATNRGLNGRPHAAAGP